MLKALAIFMTKKRVIFERRKKPPEENLHVEGNVRLFDKPFQPTIIVLLGIISVVASLILAFTFARSMFRDEVKNVLANEMLVLSTADSQAERAIQGHEERLSRLELTNQEVLGGIRELRVTVTATKDSVRDLHDEIRRLSKR